MRNWAFISVTISALQLFSLALHSQNASSVLKVEDALLNIEEHYQIRFSYSKDIVPCDDLVALAFDKRPLLDVLEDLGSQTGIIYRQRGSRVVLNHDPARKELKIASAVLMSEVEVMDSSEFTQVARSPNLLLTSTEPGSEPEVRDSIGNLTALERRQENLPESHHERRYEAKTLAIQHQEKRQWLQVSLLPARSLVDRKVSKVNHFSLNIIAGHTGGVQGLEIGGFANTVKRDVQGVQLAGFGNFIGGNVEGIQLSGFSNFNQGIMRGLQIGGFSNINVQADAVQVAGAFNLNRRISRGYQVAGFFNAGRNITGGQLAGFLNVSMGSAYFQGSGFCNVAENVDVQIAGLVNVAKRVDVLQIGLINVADTVGGFSFGLLNLIKKGYNKIEISFGDALYGNLAVKLGTRYFYNIFQVGSNFQRNNQGNGLIWGYGYGFGFFQNISKDLKFNPEVLVSNIQEKSIIKPELNLLSQVKLLFHFTENSRIEMFAGPTFNFMLSNISEENGVLIGSNISRYSLFERNYFSLINPVNAKMWIGFNAGIRI